MLSLILRFILVFGYVALAGLPAMANEIEPHDAMIIHELEESFRRDIVDAWYPRTVDTENGGFWSAFDADWKLAKGQDRFVVSQARHLWVTSQIAQFGLERRFREYSEHGYRYLRDVLWDRELGGFRSDVTVDGRPIPGKGKSAYGNAFALYGLASHHALTGDAEALRLAQEAFRWLEAHSWDGEYGGYVDKLNDDGSWRGSTRENDLGSVSSHVGLKDYNSTIHLLEALTALYHEWPDPLVRQRLMDTLVIVRDRMTTEAGYLNLHFFRDWTHASFRGEGRARILRERFLDHVSWGHDVETAFLMLEAAHALGMKDDARTMEVAKRMVDHALATGWDAAAGCLNESGYYFEGGEGCEVIDGEKVWWVAAEGLNAFLLFSRLYPGERQYREAFERQWAYIKANLIDAERGGWYGSGLDTSPEARNGPKAQIWKASYHDGRAYMNCLRMLRGDFELTRRR